MPSDPEDDAFKMFAEVYGRAWAPKGSLIAGAVTGAETKGAAAKSALPAAAAKVSTGRLHCETPVESMAEDTPPALADSRTVAMNLRLVE